MARSTAGVVGGRYGGSLDMTDKPPKPDDKLPEDEGFRDFQDTLRRLVNTPHKPHKPAQDGKQRKTR